MTSEKKLIVPHVFFYLETEKGGGTCAFTSSDGLTVPFFSSPEEANSFVKQHQLQGVHVTLINPGQFEEFAEACKRNGALYLQMDPKANTVVGVTFGTLTF